MTRLYHFLHIFLFLIKFLKDISLFLKDSNYFPMLLASHINSFVQNFSFILLTKSAIYVYFHVLYIAFIFPISTK